MGVQKNATYKVHNGTDFDEINFKTIASQVKMASGIDLESGLINSKNTNGYTKLPNGLIIQWGINDITVPKGGSNAALFNLPISFTQNYGLFGIAQASLNVNGSNAGYIDAITCVCTVADKAQVRIGISDNADRLPSALIFRINWVVMSY